MNFDAVVDRLKTQFDADTATIADVVNERQRRLIADAKWLTSQGTIATSVAGQAVYSVPATAIHVRLVTVGGAVYQWAGDEEIQQLDSSSGAWFAAGYDTTGQVKLRLSPAPDSSGLAVVAITATLPADATYGQSAALSVPQDFTEALRAGARATLLREVSERPDLAQDAEAQFKEGIIRLRARRNSLTGPGVSRARVQNYDFLETASGNGGSTTTTVISNGDGGGGTPDDDDPLAGAHRNGVDDDSALLNQYLADGGDRWIPAGTYLVNTTLLVPSNTRVHGDGPGLTTILAGASLSGAVIQNADTTAGNVAITIHDLEVNGNKAARGSDGEGIKVAITGGTIGQTNQRIHVRDCYVHDCPSLGVQYASCQHSSILGNLVRDNGRDGITLYYDCQHVRIEGNDVDGVGDDCIGLNAENLLTTGHTMRAITVVGNILEHASTTAQGTGVSCAGAQDSVIADNVISYGFTAGVVVSNFNTTPSKNVEISGNIITGAGRYSASSTQGNGVLIVGARSTTSTNGSAGVSNINVHDNVIVDPHVHGLRIVTNASGPIDGLRFDANTILFTGAAWVQATSSGISCITLASAVTNTSICNNTIHAAAQYGIYLGDGTSSLSGVRVAGNTVRNSGQAAPALGVHFEGCKNITFEGNTCIDTQGSPTQTYGVDFVAPTGFLTILSNTFSGNATGSAHLTAADSVNLAALRIAGNLGYQPWVTGGTTATGAWTSQAIGSGSVFYKDVAVTFSPAFPTGVLPRVLVSVADRTGYGINVLSLANTGFTARVWTVADPGSSVNANFSFEASAA